MVRNPLPVLFRSLYLQPFTLAIGVTYVFSVVIVVSSQQPEDTGITFENLASVKVPRGYIPSKKRWHFGLCL